MVSDKKIFSYFPYISLCKAFDPPGWGHFWPKGYNLNKLGRGQLGDDTYQISMLYIPNIKALGPVVSDKKIFSHFP